MQYEPGRDYRDVAVSASDGSLLSTAEVAALLGLKSTEGVRQMVRTGKLPAHRASGYNGRVLIPRWAALGLRRHREGAEGPQAAVPDPGGRVRQLEEALALLLEAREHEQRALELQRAAGRAEAGAAEELQHANAALSQALTRALVSDAAGLQAITRDS